MMREFVVTVRVEVPESATKEDVEQWALNRFNATSVRMSTDNPLYDEDVSATSAAEVVVSEPTGPRLRGLRQ